MAANHIRWNVHRDDGLLGHLGKNRGSSLGCPDRRAGFLEPDVHHKLRVVDRAPPDEGDVGMGAIVAVLGRDLGRTGLADPSR